jgi:hypothetical protein
MSQRSFPDSADIQQIYTPTVLKRIKDTLPRFASPYRKRWFRKAVLFWASQQLRVELDRQGDLDEIRSLKEGLIELSQAASGMVLVLRGNYRLKYALATTLRGVPEGAIPIEGLNRVDRVESELERFANAAKETASQIPVRSKPREIERDLGMCQLLELYLLFTKQKPTRRTRSSYQYEDNVGPYGPFYEFASAAWEPIYGDIRGLDGRCSQLVDATLYLERKDGVFGYGSNSSSRFNH